MAQKFLTDIEVTRGLVDSDGDLGVAGQVLSSTGTGTNWITNEANSTVVYQDGFTGDNSTVDFTLSVSVTDENVTQVYIDGVYQTKDTYSVSNTTLTFSTAPPLNADIEVITFSTATTADDLQAGVMIIPVKNTHTASIAKGEPVYITGNVGSSARLQIAPADASNSAKMPAAGLLLQTLAVNAEGYVVTGGYLRNITTDTIDGTSTSSNDTVYVKSGGGLTMTKPTGSNLIQNIAKVARVASGNAGSLIVSSILRTNDVPNEIDRNINFSDNSKLTFGNITSPDLQIYHDGSNSYISDTGTGNLFITGASNIYLQNGSNETYLDTTTNGAVRLYYDNSLKLETTSTGASITGDLSVSGDLTIDGTTTTLNTQTVEVEDNILQLNTTQGSPDTATATTSGISVYRGSGVTQASFIFDDTDDTWDLTNNLALSGKILIGTGATAAASLNAYTQTVSANLYSALRIIENSGASSYWDIGATGGGSPDLNFYVNAGTTPKLTINSSGNATFAGDVSITGGDLTLGTDSIASNINSLGDVLVFNVDSNANTGGAPNMQFKVSGTTELTLNSTTATFEGRIDIKDDLRIRGAGGTPSQGIVRFYTDSTNKLNIDTGNTGTNLTTIDSSGNATFAGNVTINKAANPTKLQIGSSLADDPFIHFQTDGENYSVGVDRSDSNKFKISNGSTVATNTRITLNTAGNVGIGTTSPACALDIAGGAISIGTGYNFDIRPDNDGNWGFSVQRTSGVDDYNTRMKFYPVNGTTRKLGFWNSLTSSWMGYFDGSTNSNNNFIINGGSVGIGTTSPAHKLDVAGSGKFQPGIADGDALVTIAQTNSNAYVHAGLKINAGNTNPFYIYQSGSSNTLRFNYNSLSDAGGQMVITDGGNVGIGTASPARKLDVRTDDGVLIKGASGTVNGKLSFLPASGGRQYDFRNAGSSFVIHDASAATDRMYFHYNGNIGIGNTSPTAKLEITGSNNTNIFRGNFGTSADIFMGFDTSNPYLILQDNSNVSTHLFQSNANNYIVGSNLGIGVTNPSFKTHFRGGSNTEETVLKLDKSSYSDAGGHTTILGLGNEPAGWAKGGIAFERTGSYDRGKIHFLQENTGTTDTVTLSDSVMTIQPDGNVGIGTTSPSEILQTNKNSAGDIVGGYFTNSQANSGAESVSLAFGLNRSGGDFVRQVKAITFGTEQQWTGTPSTVDGYLAFSTVSNETVSEKMRITSGGEIQVGNAVGGSDSDTGTRINATQMRQSSSGTGAHDFHDFYRGTEGSLVRVGNIRTTGTATAYNTSSDYRLKENVVEMAGALDRVSQLKPSRFNFIADANTTVDGFLAHEVQDIVPEAITGEKDAVDEEGNPVYQGIDQSKLVPLLVGAIKELKAEIETLKLQING